MLGNPTIRVGFLHTFHDSKSRGVRPCGFYSHARHQINDPQRGRTLDAETSGLTMAKTRIASVDEYIASQSETGQRVLKRVRSIIRKAVPDAQETIWYGIPTYKLDGRYVLYFAGWKQHYSVYLLSRRLGRSVQE